MILVVGSTGFLGSAVCRQLTEAGKSVRALVRSTSAPEKVTRLKSMGIETIEGDLRDPDSLARACVGVDAVISTATTTVSRQPGDSISVTDQQGQLDLVKAAKEAGVRKFVYISIPGSIPSCPLTTAKRAVEQAVVASGMDYTILRCGIFYEIWVSPMLGFDYINRKATIYGSGQAKNGFISLGDVARYAVESLQNPGASSQCFDIAHPQQHSWLEVVRTFEMVGSQSFELQFVPEAALEAQRASATDPLDVSFATLMMAMAQGITVDTRLAERVFGLQLVSMETYAQRCLAGVKPEVSG